MNIKVLIKEFLHFVFTDVSTHRAAVIIIPLPIKILKEPHTVSICSLWFALIPVGEYEWPETDNYCWLSPAKKLQKIMGIN